MDHNMNKRILIVYPDLPEGELVDAWLRSEKGDKRRPDVAEVRVRKPTEPDGDWRRVLKFEHGGKLYAVTIECGRDVDWQALAATALESRLQVAIEKQR